MSLSRVRQIVSEELEKRSVDSGSDHAKLQLDSLAPVMQLAAETVAAGDVTAITPYLKVLDRLDRYQTVAGANQVYDDEARKKLLDKINRIAANLGVDEVMAAAAGAPDKDWRGSRRGAGRGHGGRGRDGPGAAEGNGLEVPSAG